MAFLKVFNYYNMTVCVRVSEGNGIISTHLIHKNFKTGKGKTTVRRNVGREFYSKSTCSMNFGGYVT
jgi:hypothetical protein